MFGKRAKWGNKIAEYQYFFCRLLVHLDLFFCVCVFCVCAKLLGQTVPPEQETGAFRYQCEMHFVYQQSSLVVKSVKRQGRVCGRCSAVIQ